MTLSPAGCWDHEGRCWSQKRWFWIGSSHGSLPRLGYLLLLGTSGPLCLGLWFSRRSANTHHLRRFYCRWESDAAISPPAADPFARAAAAAAAAADAAADAYTSRMACADRCRSIKLALWSACCSRILERIAQTSFLMALLSTYNRCRQGRCTDDRRRTTRRAVRRRG